MARVRRVVGLSSVALLLSGCAGTDGGVGEPVPPFHPSSITPRSTADAKPTNTFTVVATGDVLIHPALTEQAESDGNGQRDFAPLFAGVKPVVEAADLAICHMEVPLAAAAGPFEGYPLFYAPPEVATAVAATGYDTCSTASNHTVDHGGDGVTTTLDALDAAKIGHTGSARTQQEADTPLVREVNGVKVGQVSFTFAFNQGTEEPEPWCRPTTGSPLTACSRPRSQARAAGAEVVIASLHWGIEDQHEPTDAQRETAEESWPTRPST